MCNHKNRKKRSNRDYSKLLKNIGDVLKIIGTLFEMFRDIIQWILD